MEKDSIVYQAFVSYRHAEVDSAVARDVQRGLERFRIPPSMREELGIKRIAPVFRDKEELPVSSALGDDIAYTLEHSSSLVVVCSPRTKESQWVDREIRTFLQTHDRSCVFTVFATGCQVRGRGTPKGHERLSQPTVPGNRNGGRNHLRMGCPDVPNAFPDSLW